MRYAVKKSAKGYDLEAAIPFAALGFRPSAGDRVPLSLIFVDRDPNKPDSDRFHQYLLPIRGTGDRHQAQARLLNADGWGGDLSLDTPNVGPGGSIQFVGTIDVVSKPVTMAGLEVVSLDDSKVIQRIPCAKTLRAGQARPRQRHGSASGGGGAGAI